MLKLETVQSGYGNILAVKGISLEVNRGEIITLIGANGAGKSTTLLTISGIVRCRTGKILLNEEEIQALPPMKSSKKGWCRFLREGISFQN